jgi:integrase
MGKLTALKVKSITKVGLHSDGDGLYLKVQASPDVNHPNKSWMFRWGAGGKNTMGLGRLADVTLAEARDLAAQARRLIRQGNDPRIERDRIKASATASNMTFGKAAQEYIDSEKHAWKSSKHAQQWTNTLTTYAFPVIENVACADITTRHILDILNPIWVSKHETATRVRGRIESILDRAIALGHRTAANPAKWKENLSHTLFTISKRKTVEHHPAMPYAQVPELIQRIGSNPVISSKALLICVLTATRTSETINAKWDEFDLVSKIWTIPKARMKRNIEHRVPLSDFVVEIIKSITKVDESPWVFNGQSREKGKFKSLSNMAMLNHLQETLGHSDLTVHGFRSSFRDWAGETTEHSREVIEQSLAHGLADQVEAAYQRGDYLEKRRVLMNDWASYLTGKKPSF